MRPSRDARRAGFGPIQRSEVHATNVEKRGSRSRPRLSDVLCWTALLILLGMSLLPFAMMLLLSLKTNADIFTRFWGLPQPARWDFYREAAVALRGYLLNTLIVTVVVVPGVLLFSSLAGYALARLHFRGRDEVFALIVALMVVPGILTLIPTYALVQSMGLLNTRWALILPYLAGGQVLGVVLCRTFFASLPDELFEAMRLDGAGDFQIYRYLALPLSLPTLATIAIMSTLGIYNDYIWPLVTISDSNLQTFTVGVTRFAGEFNLDYGPTLAGYVIGSLPLIVLFAIGMRAFVQGVTSGALKA
ncbi:MAG: carbohydrate ABC transporter permease [Armatimonadota bacterium]|nr:carbohydrate ABC transporter permease [bacterium]MDW8321407.1 carbohydrate ABC transporter permease [Armatimonadota bacterium]